MPTFDYAIVGGGLQGGLLAVALRYRQPDARVLLVERDARLGGNHTWCFHEGDVDEDSRAWVEPLVEWRWSGYRVRFPERSQEVDQAYYGLSSSRLHELVKRSIQMHSNSRLVLGAEASEIERGRVRLSATETCEAALVVDARGICSHPTPNTSGYQKFVGLEVRLTAEHGMDRPVLMDATVDQAEGYRFFYVLPLGDRRLLIEDTYFNGSPKLDSGQVRERVLSYAAGQGWEVEMVCREESGVLPMPWTDRIERPGRGPLLAGYRGGWFHPGTGYSFPVAARLADFVARRSPSEIYGPALDRFAAEHRGQARFARFLNRLLFRWYAPPARFHIFERFYRMSARTRSNFYALRLTARDQVAFLAGRPPRGFSVRQRLAAGAAE